MNFLLKNEVEQGGVLSPLFVSVYTDELLLQLKVFGFGSHIGHYFVGALADDVTLLGPILTADDVTLLGPILTAIKLMLSVVKTFGARMSCLMQVRPS